MAEVRRAGSAPTSANPLSPFRSRIRILKRIEAGTQTTVKRAREIRSHRRYSRLSSSSERMDSSSGPGGTHLRSKSSTTWKPAATSTGLISARAWSIIWHRAEGGALVPA